jgi:hypothetical protein
VNRAGHRRSGEHAEREIRRHGADNILSESIYRRGRRLALFRERAPTSILANDLDQRRRVDELELERDMEYFVEPEEALGPRTGDLGE